MNMPKFYLHKLLPPGVTIEQYIDLYKKTLEENGFNTSTCTFNTIKESYNTIKESYGGIIAYHCPHCHYDIVSEWYKDFRIFYFEVWGEIFESSFSLKQQDELKRIDIGIYQAQKNKKMAEFNEVLNMESCPVCGRQLSKNKGYLIVKPFVGDEETQAKKLPFVNMDEKKKDELYRKFKSGDLQAWHVCIDIMKKIRNKEKKENINVKVSKLHNSFDISPVVSVSPDDIYKMKNSPEKLKEYINHLIKMEMNIYSLSRYLENLYDHQAVLMEDVMSTMYANIPYELAKIKEEEHQIQSLKDVVSEKEKNYKKCRNTLEQCKANQSYFNSYLPKAPTQPTQPVFRTPGLFNKKKVLAENEMLAARFEKEKQDYAKAFQEYEIEKQSIIEKYTQQAKENIVEAQKELDVANSAVAKALEFLEERRANIEKTRSEAPNMELPNTLPLVCAKDMLEEEIRNAEKALKETYECRNKLYNYDIVFSKYRNPVALASFYEYLMAGRCETLEGSNGAYNIYEVELRANIVIGQLNKVIERLDQIIDNQYMIYTELKDINSNLDTLNSTMNSALYAIKDIGTSVQHISKNSDIITKNTDVIAHNTEATAYYSKRTAELTDALGFMVAFS